MIVRNKRYKFLADIVLPNSCAFCGKVIRWDRLMCDKCEADIPDTFTVSAHVDNCVKSLSVFVYEDDIIGSIYHLKHGGDINNFAELCALKIGEKLGDMKITDNIDLITAVPMNIAKRIRRGHDQAAVLARFIADVLDRPVDLSLLRRKSDKIEQHKLSRTDRAVHAAEVYFINEDHNDISGKTILICDDVITTGSTMSVCAGLLREMGAKEVYCCSAAVAAPNLKKDS